MSERKRGRKAGDFTIKVQGKTYSIPYRVIENNGEDGFDELVFVDIDKPVGLALEAKTRKELRSFVVRELEAAMAIGFRSVIRVRTYRASYTEPNNSRQVLPGQILGLSHDFLEVGTHLDGSPVWRYPNTTEIKQGEPFQGARDISFASYGGGQKNERIETHTIIPDTQDNRDRLDAKHATMAILSKQLSEAFSPEHIEQTLLETEPDQQLLDELK